MKTLKYLYLTEIVTVISELGEAKIKRIENGNIDEPKDVHGHTIEWYREANLKPPKELLEYKPLDDEIDENGDIELQEGEFEYQFNDCLIDIKSFDYATDHEELGSLIYFKTRKGCIRVEETVEEIHGQIWYMNRNWLDKLKEEINIIKNKLRRLVQTHKK